MAPASCMKKEGSSLLTWINVDSDDNMHCHHLDDRAVMGLG